jgi:recombinational DNA repair protein RecR
VAWENVLPTIGIGGTAGAAALLALRVIVSSDKMRLSQVREAQKEADDRQLRLDSSRDRIDKLEEENAELHRLKTQAESVAIIAQAHENALKAQVEYLKEQIKARDAEIKRLANG